MVNAHNSFKVFLLSSLLHLTYFPFLLAFSISISLLTLQQQQVTLIPKKKQATETETVAST